MEAATRAKLTARFKAQTDQLSQLTRLDLTDWWEERR
jgi:hypothetical protein